MKEPNVLHLFLLTILLCSLGGSIQAEAVEPSIGEWSIDCNPAFHIAAMPSVWDFNPAQGPLQITSRVAIDYEVLPSSDWEMVIGATEEASYARLLGYEDLLLEAQIFPVGSLEPVALLDGRYSITEGSAAVVFTWDGRDRTGQPVKTGRYEIEVHGRFIPTSLDLKADAMNYRDLDGWSEVAEVCTRTLRVNVTDALQPPPNRAPSSDLCPSPPALPSDYYDTVNTSNASTLRSTLHDVIDNHTRFPYSDTSTDTWDILNDADEDPSSPSNLLTVYRNESNADGCSTGCTWNREHTWAKSYGFSEESGAARTPYTDCHQLRAANASYNSSRGNRPFDDCLSGCTTYGTDVNNGFGGTGEDNLGRGDNSIACGETPTSDSVWQIWDHRKGDVARAMLYMDVRYSGDSGIYGSEQDLILTDNLALMTVETTTCGDGFQDPGYFGLLTTLLEWHCADPVDSDEIRRNEQVWCHQGNRNPFVDHPEYTDILYGTTCGGPDFAGISAAADIDECDSTGVQIDWTTPTSWNDGCSSSCSRGFKVFRNGTTEITSGDCGGTLGEGATTCDDTAGSVGVTYSYSVEAYNDLAQTEDGGVDLDAADDTNDGTPPQITVGPSATPATTSFTATWTTDEDSDSYLEWGTSSGNRPFQASNATLVTGHSLDATSLDPGTEYFYVVCSTDECNYGPTCSSEASVSTLAADTAPSVSSTTPSNGATGVAVDANVDITFSEAVSVGSWYTLNCGSSGAHSAVTSGGPTTYTLNPDVDFDMGELCSVFVYASGVTDNDTNDPPDNMTGDYAFSFTTTTGAPEEVFSDDFESGDTNAWSTTVP